MEMAMRGDYEGYTKCTRRVRSLIKIFQKIRITTREKEDNQPHVNMMDEFKKIPKKHIQKVLRIRLALNRDAEDKTKSPSKPAKPGTDCGETSCSLFLLTVCNFPLQKNNSFIFYG